MGSEQLAGNLQVAVVYLRNDETPLSLADITYRARWTECFRQLYMVSEKLAGDLQVAVVYLPNDETLLSLADVRETLRNLKGEKADDSAVLKVGSKAIIHGLYAVPSTMW